MRRTGLFIVGALIAAGAGLAVATPASAAVGAQPSGPWPSYCDDYYPGYGNTWSWDYCDDYYPGYHNWYSNRYGNWYGHRRGHRHHHPLVVSLAS